MAITKSADKKSAQKKGPAEIEQDPMEALAEELLITQLHRALVEIGEPARINEVLRVIGDDAISSGLARHMMESKSRRFAAVDRRWDITERYLDRQSPVSKTLQEIVTTYGAPITPEAAANELAAIYGREKEVLVDTATRLLKDKHYFNIDSSNEYGLRSWLLDTNSSNESDVLFYNYLTAEAIGAYKSIVKNLEWEDPLAAILTIMEASNNLTFDNRILQYFAWKGMGDDFDAEELYSLMYTSNHQFVTLPDHRWVLADKLNGIRDVWTKMAEHVEEYVEEPVVEVVSDEPAKPLEINDNDFNDLRNYINDREDFVTVQELLSDVLEIGPNSRTYEDDVTTLTNFLLDHPDDFTWVGTTRFQAPGLLPPYLGQLPESLTFPVLPRFETADGEILDQMLDDAAFDDALVEEMNFSVAQDVGDQELEEYTRWPEDVSIEAPSIRLVLKAHHKEIGTFPLSQIPRGFLPAEPDIVELTFIDSAGNSSPVYADYNVQLIYGLFDFYAEIAADSGAVFNLEKTDDPAVYRFVNNNETDNAVFVSPHRLEELLDMRSEVEAGPISTYDIVRRILDHYRKGCSFLTLLTEVNLVRRTPRHLLASILSGYTAFHERANRWTFDPKREEEGFDRRKSQYIIKK